MRNVLPFALVFFTITFIGCPRSPEAQPKQRPLPTSVELAGDVFIVTRGGDNIKLGLVTVTAIPESAMLAHVLARRTLAASEHSRIRPQVLTARESLAAARAAEVNADRTYQSAVDSRAARPVIDRAWDDYKRATELTRRRADALSTLERADAYPGAAPFYFENLPAGLSNAKTDADGKFVMTLAAGARVALVAHSRRQVLDQTEDYYWMVWATPSTGGPARIFLSNDNLLTVPNPESVVLAEDGQHL